MSEKTSGAMLDKTFDPAAIEAKWYAHWEANGLFRPERPDAEPFTIVNPPPNVTGSLHIGHALDNTLQDIVVRHERLKGKDALWVVGTDHAGIATQMVVERNLASQGVKRTDMTREQFVEHVWEWKEQSGGQITRQLRRLGCSMDWSREQFTMDPHFTRAVVKVFVDLYDEGLIYRDKRLVNWDPKLRTAISDLEVETREMQGHFWHFRYPLADGVKLDNGADHIVVATTRPETMLADMAVAVHPDDPRYRSVIGKHILQPITGRRLVIVADEHADPELGSGAVKITPGHDFNDFEVGKRAGIKPAEMLNMFDAEAKVVQTADGLIPDAFLGLDRFAARLRVAAMLDELGLLGEVEDRTVPTPYGDRGGVVIEPWLTDQWYVDAEALAQPAIEAVRSGAIEIVPKSWEKTFFNWMENIQPWCVSRQLWWGHRIPAWYGPAVTPFGYDWVNPTHFVAETEADAVRLAREYYSQFVEDSFEIKTFSRHVDADLHIKSYGKEIPLYRDEDVLDTWFSSALWPFATLGWPDLPYDPETVRPELVEGPSFSSGAALEHKNGASTSSARTEDGAPRDLLQRHYPNDLLISGFDILFFWDARMMMQGLHFMQDVPFRRLYLHGLVRAPDGQKMSKSKGNVVDPLGLIDRYGADALRFFMAAMESQGRDIKMDEKRVEGYRNFATKLWNAARFCQANGIGASTSIAAPQATLAVNKWIIGEVVETLAALDKAMAELRFDAAANTIYHFVWDRFCDWYVELIKPLLNPPPPGEGDQAQHGGGARADSVTSDDSSKPNVPLHHPAGGPPPRSGEDETRAVAGWALDQILVMLHPFMPFVTEELWSNMGERAHYPLITAKWPKPGAEVDAGAKAEIEWLIGLIREIRASRNELNVPASARPTMTVFFQSPKVEQYLLTHEDALMRLSRVGLLYPERGREKDHILDRVQTSLARKGAILIERKGFGANIDLQGVIDVEAEKTRLAKALATSEKERDSIAKRLENPAFVEKAKPEAVEKARADHAHHSAEAERLAAALARLG